MEIYKEAFMKSEAMKECTQFTAPGIMAKIYSDSIVQYLDEQADLVSYSCNEHNCSGLAPRRYNGCPQCFDQASLGGGKHG